ncbi:MAG: HAD family hydrolase [Erysipelotrichaceae bacterium]|nr:HAD family hydrolase [Erysipelotrichaceae bacterium]
MIDVDLLALDLDGTFFDEDTHVSEENIKAIRQLHNQGTIIVPVSGRNIHDEFDFMESIEVPYFIGSNGAVIKDRNKNEIIYHEYMDYEEAIRLVEYFEKSGLYVYAACDDDMYHNYMNVTDNLVSTYPLLFNHPFLDIPLSLYLVDHCKNIEKIGTLLDTHDQVELALREKDSYSKIEIVQSNTLSVEAYSKMTNKGIALKWLMNILNISKEHVVAIGDSDSDVAMFQCCGYAIAMENGTDNAKNVADYITLSNKQNGVAYAINKLLKKHD